MKKITSFFTLLFCLFWYSTCFGVMSKTNVIVSDSAIKDVVLGAKATTTNPTYTDTATVPLSVDTSGNLRVTGSISGRTLTSSTAYANITTATTTQLVAASGSLSIKVYGYHLNGDNGQTYTFKYGTGVNCGTGTTTLTHGMYAANGAGTSLPTIAMSNIPIFIAPASTALCITTSAAIATSGATITYIQE